MTPLNRRRSGLDVIYVAWNRLEFTRLTFELLMANTDWDLVDRLVVVDDGSTDGTREWLIERMHHTGEGFCTSGDARLVESRLGSPVKVMSEYLNGKPAEWFVKIDNDVALCPGWLNALLSVRSDDTDIIGFEAGMTAAPDRGPGYGDPPFDGTYHVEPSRHIGGVGLLRTRVFDHRPLRANGRYFGFTEWQHHAHGVRRGWLTPSLPCPLLDRMPVDPCPALSARYRLEGWQREWPTYDPVWMKWSWEWLLPELDTMEVTRAT